MPNFNRIRCCVTLFYQHCLWIVTRHSMAARGCGTHIKHGERLAAACLAVRHESSIVWALQALVDLALDVSCKKQGTCLVKTASTLNVIGTHCLPAVCAYAHIVQSAEPMSRESTCVFNSAEYSKGLSLGAYFHRPPAVWWLLAGLHQSGRCPGPCQCGWRCPGKL